MMSGVRAFVDRSYTKFLQALATLQTPATTGRGHHAPKKPSNSDHIGPDDTSNERDPADRLPVRLPLSQSHRARLTCSREKVIVCRLRTTSTCYFWFQHWHYVLSYVTEKKRWPAAFYYDQHWTYESLHTYRHRPDVAPGPPQRRRSTTPRSRGRALQTTDYIDRHPRKKQQEQILRNLVPS